MVRRISTFLGRPAKCPRPRCQRHGRCGGNPPDCWRDEPPPSQEEITIAKAIMQREIKKLRDQ